ncbi:hypothetical protein PGT21_023705 [Puccinia graminis f. sp. tritici]|uniref:Uncharacterized protein n=1 Tax=Puccinia graminis f. sp. tritici TaxID=56615 RepID=A0A5B0M9W7_PUCGR|nr:hypothetical protein PGT21_023705 [Puccinia graminis f. sp. tritici]KAA1072644.1 hypothetical protein PGTUg99_007378 [Puccinia graminis f. sp. tritici]
MGHTPNGHSPEVSLLVQQLAPYPQRNLPNLRPNWTTELNGSPGAPAPESVPLRLAGAQMEKYTNQPYQNVYEEERPDQHFPKTIKREWKANLSRPPGGYTLGMITSVKDDKTCGLNPSTTSHSFTLPLWKHVCMSYAKPLCLDMKPKAVNSGTNNIRTESHWKFSRIFRFSNEGFSKKYRLPIQVIPRALLMARGEVRSGRLMGAPVRQGVFSGSSYVPIRGSMPTVTSSNKPVRRLLGETASDQPCIPLGLGTI